MDQEEMKKSRKKEKPEEEDLEWVIEQRAEVQRTLLALYRFVRHRTPIASVVVGYLNAVTV